MHLIIFKADSAKMKSMRPRVLDAGARTRAVPLLERRYHRNVSDSIANNYSPGAKHLSALAVFESTRFGAL